MGIGFIDSSDDSTVHPELKDWLDKAREACIGQKIVGISGQDKNTVVIHLENGKALVFADAFAKGIGHCVAKLETPPETNPSPSNN